ncbi:MAG: SDR family oxidoreductase [Chloroflexota bacterium]
MTTHLITGANRGLGWAMVQQLAQTDGIVFAGCRSPQSSADLQALAAKNDNIYMVQLDVADENSVMAAAKVIAAETEKIDVLINNAGIKLDEKDLQDITVENVQKTMNVNVVGPLLMAKHFVGLLKRSNQARLVNISGRLASLLLLEHQSWGSYTYNASKAAMNVTTRMMAHELKPIGICVVAVHPGWMQTDMGGAAADLEPSVAAESVLALTANLTLADTNKFLVYNGEEHPW